MATSGSATAQTAYLLLTLHPDITHDQIRKKLCVRVDFTRLFIAIFSRFITLQTEEYSWLAHWIVANNSDGARSPDETSPHRFAASASTPRVRRFGYRFGYV
jgi:hypothetical protein